MSLPENILSAQLQHLLEKLDAHRQAHCEELLAQTRSEAQLVIKHAYQTARHRVHQAVVNTREHTRLQLVSAAARQKTRERQLRQQQDQALLEQVWQPLQEILLQRWQDPATRRQWIDQLLEQAAQVLVDTNW